MKIKAYTLFEVTIAMLLSAICIAICYSAYGIIAKYYVGFQQKNQTADAVLTLRHVLEKDFLKSNIVLKNEEGLEMQQDSSKIYYIFNPDAVLRKIDELHTDTFKLKPIEVGCFFEGREVLEPDTIDELRFKMDLAQHVLVPIQLNKTYSAQNLFN